MRFSIVTISYNQAAFLERAIQSVLNQKEVDVEYIVVDPGSRDGSRDILYSLRDRFAALVLDPDSGPAHGLNNGFAAATGSIYGFLNADDEFLPGALARVAEAFERRPLIDVISGCGYSIDSRGRRLGAIVPSTVTPWLHAHGAVTVFQPGTFFKSRCFREVGGFNAGNRTCWDGELFLDMALAGARFATLNADLANFRVHAASITGSGRLNEAYRADVERLFEKALGRKRAGGDRWVGAMARAAKWLLSPAYLPRRLARLRLDSSMPRAT